ncbi:MAG: hypothetical protein H6818_05960 [Phycisphaerales bacterium]|nr:hypothetical protein [Phycisphaerales bacterium]MCB9862808.1 hypothetical protein [Phycisphaerales bacterium]
MRVAVVQLEVDPSSRSKTLQRAMRAMDKAAEADPAPDLVVLPAFADTCVETADAVLEGTYGATAAACGFRARSWGVFAAMGFAERARPLPRLIGILFDQDGDHRLIQPLKRAGKSLAGRYAVSAAPLESVDVLLGRIAVLVDDDILDEDSWREVVTAGAQLIVGTIGAGAISEKAIDTALSKLAKQFGRPCVVADMTTCGKKGPVRRHGVSRIVERDGSIVASAAADAADILTAQINLPSDAAWDESTSASRIGEQ